MEMPVLAPHQERAVDRVLGATELLVEYGTGTGKSRIIVEAVVACVGAGDIPVIVCVPNALIEQTTEEFERWAGRSWVDKHLTVLDGSTTIYLRREALKRGRSNVYLLSHESLSYPLIREGLRSRTWGAAFVDEASRFRNYSKRTISLQTLGRQSLSRYAFTGNLMVRTPADIWYVMNFLRPGIFGTKNLGTFKSEYCVLGGFTGQEAVGIRPDRLKKLRAHMDSLRITCELRDIRDMPERVLTQRRVNLVGSQADAYNEMKETLRMEIEREDEENFRSNVRTYATRLLRLQEISAGFGRNIDGEVVYLPSPKTKELCELLLSEPDIPTVVWYWWRPESTRIQAEFAKNAIPFTVFGQDPHAREDFLSGKTNVFLSQLAKGGYGLNLTRAVRMIYHSLPWSLDIMTQSTERNMRLTTTATSLEVVHLIVRKTTDEEVRRKLIERAGMSRQLSRSQALDMLR